MKSVEILIATRHFVFWSDYNVLCFLLFFSKYTEEVYSVQELDLPRPPGNITFEIPARELYCPVTISGLSQSIVNRRQR
jgi:hypothetical protein